MKDKKQVFHSDKSNFWPWVPKLNFGTQDGNQDDVHDKLEDRLI